MAEPPEVTASASQAEIVPSTSAMPLTLEYAKRKMRMLTITETELDDLASSSGSIHLSFLGIGVGALIAFGIGLSTVDIPNPKTYAMFVSLTGLAALATLFFGVNAIRDYVARRRRVHRIKSGLF